MRLLENYVARAEQLLNPFDWIQYVSSLGGMSRVIAGAVQIAASIIFAYLKVAYNLVNRRRVVDALKEASVYAMHGAANIVRGAFAIHPGWNLLLAVHDWKLGRLNYPEETVKPGVYPLATAYKLAQY